jgi:hypothetical protein
MASAAQVTPANELWSQLWVKQQALYDYLQRLNDEVLPDDKPNYAGTIGNANYEIERIEAILVALGGNQPIPFPSDDQVDALRASVGRLQQAIVGSANVNELLAAATAVIATWPLSHGG